MRPSKLQFAQRELTNIFRYYILNFSFLWLKKFKQKKHQDRWSNFSRLLEIFCYSPQVLRNPFHTSYNGRDYLKRWKGIKASLDINAFCARPTFKTRYRISPWVKNVASPYASYCVSVSIICCILAIFRRC